MGKVIAINGSPRKNWNTYTLLDNALAGARDFGDEVQLYNLYDYSYQGCTSCFSCKINENGQCVKKDGLMPILREIYECKALILGSPIYFGSVSSGMSAFLERLLYPFRLYTDNKIMYMSMVKSLFVYTMNRPLEAAYEGGYRETILEKNKKLIERFLGKSEYFIVTETYQFDYNKYPCTQYDGTQRFDRKHTVFAEDCRKAYEMGKNLCG